MDQYHDYPLAKNPKVVYPEEYVFENGKWMGPSSVERGGGSAYRELPWRQLMRENPTLARQLLKQRAAGALRGLKVLAGAGLRGIGKVLASPHVQAFMTGWEIGEGINHFKPGGPMGPTVGECIQESLGFNNFWSWYYTSR
jgi:hypothetical protein